MGGDLHEAGGGVNSGDVTATWTSWQGPIGPVRLGDDHSSLRVLKLLTSSTATAQESIRQRSSVLTEHSSQAIFL